VNISQPKLRSEKFDDDDDDDDNNSKKFEGQAYIWKLRSLQFLGPSLNPCSLNDDETLHWVSGNAYILLFV